MSDTSLKPLDSNKPILVFGRDGQVGRALQSCFKASKMPVVFLGRSDCDLSDDLSIIEVLNHYQPQVILNAAAYTEVDKAESEGERELVFAINAIAPKIISQYVARVPHGILVHYSSDYVFADTKNTAYFEFDTAGPMEYLSVYGQSKLAGERAIEEAFSIAHDVASSSYQDFFSKYFILRTSWVYGDGDNFIKSILRLASEAEQLKVVADQAGVPTSANWLAEIGLQIAASEVQSGIYHAVPDGETSWYELSIFAIETALNCDQSLEIKPENIHPVSAKEYRLPTKRPYNSRLENKKLKKALSEMDFKLEYPHWREQVRHYVEDYIKKYKKHV